MQPDPRVFLPAIRREMLRDDLFGQALSDGLTPILMLRAAEGLLQLELRGERLPALLRPLQGAQRALLEDTRGAFEARHIAPPRELDDALRLPAVAGAAGEDDVGYYEAVVAGVAAGLAALRTGGPAQTDSSSALQALVAKASRLEHQVRTAAADALAELRRALDADRGQTPAPRAAPTAAQLTAVLRELLPQHPAIEIASLRPLPGTNAQEVFLVELRHLPQTSGAAVLRRTPDYNPTRSSLVAEAQLLTRLHGAGLPVARVLAAASAGTALGGAFILLERLPGKPETAASLGERGRTVGLEAARVLARIHRIDPRALGGAYADARVSVTSAMATLIDRHYGRWIEERIEPSLVLEAGFTWLRQNAALLDDEVVLVHGDYNLRNLLIDGTRVSAVLDWELAHPGHAAEDLAYLRPDVESVLPWPAFLDAYVSAGGRAPAPEALRYFDVWRDVWRSALAACVSGSFARRTHRNFIYGTVAFNEYHANLDSLAAVMARENP